MSEIKKMKSELTCEPIDNYDDIIKYLHDPPPWRSLCQCIKSHSTLALENNKDLNNDFTSNLCCLPSNVNFYCHFSPDTQNLKRRELKKMPRTLVCHDMANGYHDDKYVDGTGNFDAYSFYNWSGIDIFCYFSHHFITIPPLGWINIGHMHGVKVLGTIITEWDPGFKLWEMILDSEKEWMNFANMLVGIAKKMKFDGWLLNIENKISKPLSLRMFVKYFHTILHQELKEPVLIWYDSVTIDGVLDWQNGLNSKNKDFFDACDGIFTNYSWNEEHVKNSSILAGERLLDLYIGIDVWGRNFLGGGKFNTQEALKIAYKYGCSTAIFAQAWTHEAIPDEETCHLDKFEQFILRDRALWTTLWAYLKTRLPSVLPFQTSFCRGQGKKRRFYGEVICPVPWYNLRHMQYQPNSNLSNQGLRITTMKHLESILQNDDEETLDHVSEVANEISINKDVTKNEMSMLERLRKLYSNSSHDKSNAIKSCDNIISAQLPAVVSSGSSIKDDDQRTLVLLHVQEELECLEVYLEDSFVGGSCLKINPKDECDSNHRCIILFKSDFGVEFGIIICVVTKTFPGFESQTLNVRLSVTNSEEVTKTFILTGNSNQPATEDDQTYVFALNDENNDNESFREVQKYLLLNQPGFYIPTENCYDWKVRYFKLMVPQSRVTLVACKTEITEGPILLGYIGLCSYSKDDILNS